MEAKNKQPWSGKSLLITGLGLFFIIPGLLGGISLLTVLYVGTDSPSGNIAVLLSGGLSILGYASNLAGIFFTIKGILRLRANKITNNVSGSIQPSIKMHKSLLHEITPYVPLVITTLLLIVASVSTSVADSSLSPADRGEGAGWLWLAFIPIFGFLYFASAIFAVLVYALRYRRNKKFNQEQAPQQVLSSVPEQDASPQDEDRQAA